MNEPKPMFKSWYNYRTKQFEECNPVTYEDYIPQMPAAQGLYQCLVMMGKTPLEAAADVLRACVGEKRP